VAKNKGKGQITYCIATALQDWEKAYNSQHFYWKGGRRVKKVLGKSLDRNSDSFFFFFSNTESRTQGLEWYLVLRKLFILMQDEEMILLSYIILKGQFKMD
jgi:hypothetical protein